MWGKKSFMFTHVMFFLCITCLNIASIVDTAQVIDQILARQFSNGTIAFQFAIPGRGNQNEGGIIDYELLWWNRKQCLMGASRLGQDDFEDMDDCIPFQSVSSGHDTWIITVGYLIAGLLFLPLSLKDLKVGHFC